MFQKSAGKVKEFVFKFMNYRMFFPNSIQTHAVQPNTDEPPARTFFVFLPQPSLTFYARLIQQS